MFKTIIVLKLLKVKLNYLLMIILIKSENRLIIVLILNLFMLIS